MANATTPAISTPNAVTVEDAAAPDVAGAENEYVLVHGTACTNGIAVAESVKVTVNIEAEGLAMVTGLARACASAADRIRWDEENCHSVRVGAVART